MKKPFSKTIVFIIPSLLALSAAAFLYTRLYQQISVSADRDRLAEDIIQAEGNAENESSNLQMEYQSTAASRMRLPGLFVPAANAVVFIEALESIGPASGATISIDSIQADPLDTAAPGTTGTIAAQVTAHGSWEAVMKALVLSESLPYQDTVDHIDLVEDRLSTDPASKSTWQISYEVSALQLAGAAPSIQ